MKRRRFVRYPDFPYPKRGTPCAYCQRPMDHPSKASQLAATRDHVVPKSKGGCEMIWCCSQCNNIKDNMMPEEWAEFMVANPEWWRRPSLARYGRSARHRTLAEVSDFWAKSTDPRIVITADWRGKE